MAAYEDQQSIAAQSSRTFLPPQRGFSIAVSLSDEGDDSPSSSSSSLEEDSSLEEIEIFVQSPTSAQRRQRIARRDKAMSACCAPVCARHGIRRMASAREGWPGLQPIGKAREESQEAVSEQQLKRRAAEHTMRACLKQLAFKQQLRFRHVGSEDVSPTQQMKERQQVRTAAQDFTETYGKTLDIFEQHMTLRKPTRRHSIAIADLQAYSEETLASDSSVRRHSCDCWMGPPAACL